MAKLSVEQFADVTSILFAAALDPARWQDFLDRLSTHMGVVNTHLYGYDFASNLGLDLLHHGYAPEFMQSYHEHYGTLNAWAPGLAKTPVGKVVTSAQSFPEEELFKTAFYNEWVLPQGDLRTGAGVILARDESRFFVLGGNMSQRHAGHEQDFFDTLTLLTPHMRRALEISRTMFNETIQVVAGQKFSGQSSGGALLALTTTRQVIYANPAAQALAEIGATLRFSALGRLHFVDMAADNVLQQALDAMAQRRGAPSASLQLRHPHGGVTQVRLARIESDRLGFMPLGMASGSGEPHLLISLSPPPDTAKSDELLRHGFGLTESEIRVAGLIADGLTSREIADARQVSLHTVRDQIKAALAKTGSRRQIELVRLLQNIRGAAAEA
ncbi:helix-turn-helix transcriptional regulator [Devosia sp. A449]